MQFQFEGAKSFLLHVLNFCLIKEIVFFTSILLPSSKMSTSLS